MSDRYHIVTGNRLPVLEVTLEAGDSTTLATRQALARTNYGAASAASIRFRKRGASTSEAVTGTIDIATAAQIKVTYAWLGTEGPVITGGQGEWDFWIELTVSSKVISFPNDGTAFALKSTLRVTV